MTGVWLCVCALLSTAFFTSTSAEEEDLIGQRMEVDVNNSGVQNAAELAVREFNKLSSSTFAMVEIMKAERQVVAGLNYYLMVKIGLNGNDIFSNESKICEFVVYDRPWIDTKELTSFTCNW